MPGVVEFMCTIRAFFHTFFQPLLRALRYSTNHALPSQLSFRTPRQRTRGCEKRPKVERKKKSAFVLICLVKRKVSQPPIIRDCAAFGLSRSCGWRGTVG